VATSPSSTDVKSIWVAITAHKPLERLSTLLNTLSQYDSFPYRVTACIYIDYGSQGDLEFLEKSVNIFKNVNTSVKVASPGYEGWYLTWAHKTDLALEILNRKHDYYIYQENDMALNLDNFHYWLAWKPRLAKSGFEPGFIRYEEYNGLCVPFDNHYRYSLLRETPNVWSDVGFTVPKILVVDHEISVFVQAANPYYGAVILDQKDGEAYIRSDSFDPEKSYARVGIRNWPIADRSSMGLAFEDVPAGYEHRRCIPLIKKNGKYIPKACCLMKHNDYKYAPELSKNGVDLIDCTEMFVLE